MKKHLSHCTYLVGALVLLAFATLTTDAALIAHSQQDWVAALPTGTPGVADQFHADASGSGTWSYHFGNSTFDGGAFGGGFPTFDDWKGTGWGRAGGVTTYIYETAVLPHGPLIASDSLSYRRWSSNGANSGDTLYGVLTYTPATNGLVDVFLAGDISFNQVITHDTADNGTEFQIHFSFTDSPTMRVLAGVDSSGLGLGEGSGAGNHIGDSAVMTLVITDTDPIPEPTSAALFALATIGLVARRRRV